MIKLGFDDKTYEIDEETGEPIPKETLGIDKDSEEPIKPVYIPKHLEEELLNDFKTFIVRDFGDDYHLSEDERSESNKFYKSFKKILMQKHTYRDLPRYIKAVRDTLECLDFIAENNGVYDPEKFKILFFKGKIKINGLSIPKFSGKESKIVSPEYLLEFILSDRDPSEINPRRVDPIFTDEETEEMAHTLFDEDELKEIEKSSHKETDMETVMTFTNGDKEDESNLSIVVPLSKKKTREMIKSQPESLYNIKEMRKAARSLENLSSFVHDLRNDDMEQISKYDKIHGYKSMAEVPQFEGDLMDKKAYRKYMTRLFEYADTQIKVNYNGRMKTQEQIDEIELKQVLEANGWNIRNLYENKSREKKMEQARKEDKKREKRLKKKLTQIQERRERRRTMNDSSGGKKKKKGKISLK